VRNGICQNEVCGTAVVCCSCGKVKYPDGSYKASGITPKKVSHSVCIGCIKEIYPPTQVKMFLSKMIARKIIKELTNG
jgi:hypothetical protein